MSEWVERPLAELATIRVSNVDKKSLPNEQAVRLCNYMDVYAGTYLDDDVEYMEATATAREIGNFALQVGDVVITKDSESPDDIGIPALIETTSGGLVCGYHLAMLRPDRNKVDPLFLLKQIETDSVRRFYSKRAAGSTRYALATGTIAATPIKVPPLQDQTIIARILRALDTQIEATEGLIAKQERVRAGLIQDLFTRGVDEHGQLRPPRHEAPHLYHQTDLGWLPLGWEADSILRYCTVDRQPILTGPFGADLGSADFVDEGVPLLRIGNVQDRHLRLDDLLFVSEHKAQQLAKYRITSNDLLFARQGATTGRNALASEKVDGALINYHIIRVSLDPKKCSPRFVESMFNSWLITHQIEQSKGRGTREGINTQQITSLLFPGPDVAEQIRITATLHEAMTAIEAMKGEIAKLALKKSGLMQDLLSGNVSVAPLLESVLT